MSLFLYGLFTQVMYTLSSFKSKWPIINGAVECRPLFVFLKRQTDITGHRGAAKTGRKTKWEFETWTLVICMHDLTFLLKGLFDHL